MINKHQGILRKMHALPKKTVHYYLRVGDEQFALNTYLGQPIRLEFLGVIYCLHCGKKTKTSFQQGYCYPCFQKLARCDQCIIRPEMCHFHQGTCREPDWGERHCMMGHVVYLANSSGLKVGITRKVNRFTRWIDQGAIQGLTVFSVSQRLHAGLLEVALKSYVADKTNWRTMLKNAVEPLALPLLRNQLFEQAQRAIEATLAKIPDAKKLTDEKVHTFHYPVMEYPKTIKSLSLEKTPLIEGKLLGIKGQYLILNTGVINIRKFSGYSVNLSLGHL